MWPCRSFGEFVVEAPAIVGIGDSLVYFVEDDVKSVFSMPYRAGQAVEIIERRGEDGFGEGNFKALFDPRSRTRFGADPCALRRQSGSHPYFPRAHTMKSSKTTVALSNPHPVRGNTDVFRTFNYAPAVAAGGLLFIAGQIGIRADGTVPGSVEEQIDLAFRRLGAILQAAGLGFEDLVELVSYHVDVDKQLAAFREIKDRYIKEEAPAWTILGVAALARPTLLVEIKAVAATRGA